MSLPKFQTDVQALYLMQTQWASVLDPIINLPINSSVILKNVSLSTGTNTINHMLGVPLQGWMVIRQRAAATIYDSQDSNKIPAQTLTLVASAPVKVDLLVF